MIGGFVVVVIILVLYHALWCIVIEILVIVVLYFEVVAIIYLGVLFALYRFWICLGIGEILPNFL